MKKSNKPEEYKAPQLLTRLSGENSIPTEDVSDDTIHTEGFYTPIGKNVIYGAPEWEYLADIIGVYENQWEYGENPFVDLLTEHIDTEETVKALIEKVYELKLEIKVLREMLNGR